MKSNCIRSEQLRIQVMGLGDLQHCLDQGGMLGGEAVVDPGSITPFHHPSSLAQSSEMAGDCVLWGLHRIHELTHATFIQR
ncbi:MAG: hypothetical protein ABT24_08315 [Thiomonas sp. SCN 64-16]|nr:MAG: hypothetical protein ABT24_08315 [Thiomonas sp. SCN 64-16]